MDRRTGLNAHFAAIIQNLDVLEPPSGIDHHRVSCRLPGQAGPSSSEADLQVAPVGGSHDAGHLAGTVGAHDSLRNEQVV